MKYGRAGLGVLILVLTACQPPSKKSVGGGGAVPPRRLNVVLVTLDTLRADRLGCYGYSQIETPNLDRLAQRGVLFESAVAQAPLTAPSHASMLTGTYPTVHQVRDTGGFVLPPSSTTLAEVLQQQGWQTAAFIGASVLKKGFGLNQGFAVYDDRMPKSSPQKVAVEFPERRAGEVVDRAIQWLDRQSSQPFFLWVHLFDPHAPYDPPPPFREKYSGRPYDGEVAYTDQQVGRLLEAVARKSPPENTLIAVLSDHGESLSEHGEYTHGVFLYDATLRVAFLMAGPGVPRGMRVKPQARTIDLLPTLLELLGTKAPAGVQGVSLVPAFAGRSAPATESYAETVFPKINLGWAELRAVRTDRWKYIRAPKPELYDLAQDPRETTNVIASHAKEAAELEAKLKVAAGSGGGQGPEKVRTVMADQRTMEQLRSLGYLGGASGQDFALSGKGIDPKDRTEVLKLLHFAAEPKVPATRRVAMLRQALALDPANPMIYYHLGEAYAKSGRHAEALKLYREGIQNGIETGWLYSRLGFLYLRQGKGAEAIAAYERAAQLNPSDCESLSDLATARLEAGQLAEAERAFKWCLATDAEYAPAHNGLGLVAVQKRNLSAARGHFEKAVQLAPDLLEAQLNLGRIYKMTGATAQARACFEAFLSKASPAEYADLIPRIRDELATMQ